MMQILECPMIRYDEKIGMPWFGKMDDGKSGKIGNLEIEKFENHKSSHLRDFSTR
jgi:hypothetical protein